MKILILTKKIPFPANDGESYAVSMLAKELHVLGVELDLMSFNTSKHFVENIEGIKPSFFNKVYSVYLDNHPKYIPALRNILFEKQSYHITRFKSDEFTQKLIKVLSDNKYDIVQLESLFMAPYIETIRTYSTSQISMRSHNIEHEIWQNLIPKESNPLKRKYLKIMTDRLMRYEHSMVNQVDTLVSISHLDLIKYKKWGLSKESINCPVGMKVDDGQISDYNNELFFLGSLDWLPNVNGLNWFLEKVWPLILLKRPSSKLNVAGRNAKMCKLSIPDNDSVVFHGEIENSKNYILKYGTMIAPLFSGSGIRVKILEAMSCGRVVITTTKGAQGIEAKDGIHLLKAEDPEGFAKASLRVLEENNYRNNMGKEAKRFISKHFNASSIAKNLYTHYQKMINK